MAAQNLTHDRQFRYIICWFSEFSELQREDFYPILLEYLSQKTTENVNGIYMNGLVNAISNVGINNKPMSLFQCRMKLFREWSVKWPLDFQQKLKEKIIEIDPTVGEKIMHEMKAHNGNGLSNGLNDNDEAVMGTATDDIVNATVEAITTDNHLAAMLNETSVDNDNDQVDNDNDAQINVVHVIEHTEQAQAYTVQQQTEPQQQQDHALVISLNNGAEVPLVA